MAVAEARACPVALYYLLSLDTSKPSAFSLLTILSSFSLHVSIGYIKRFEIIVPGSLCFSPSTFNKPYCVYSASP